MFELKHLTPAGIPAALEKADQYRLLNQPWAAESICWDIAAVDPGNQPALRTKLLAQTDQFGERVAKAGLDQRAPGARFAAYDELREAMDWYEKAEAIRPAGDDDASLRWNTCARLLNQSPHIAPRPEEVREPALGE